MEDKLYLYPLWVRSWHWLNAILCLILIITGLSMQYSDPEYPIIRFDYSVAIHDTAGIVLTVSYLFFLLGNIFTSNGNQYLFRLKGYFKNVSKQFRYYAYGMFKGENPPFEITEKNKFNPLQRFSYVVIMYIATPVVVITGLMLLYPEYFLHDIFGNRSIHYTDLVHVVVGFIISLFMIIHVYFCTIGLKPWSNFRAMFTGFHEKH
ncbi:MAG: cytochrome b/b6 domain-containing protein [Bacteroidales bacterium]|jgi:thiosulfate reductase cytochrome b subunit|nr:cytochrome b/b6 domain-containing protein [Bacteroidales bacterium]